MNVVHLYKYYTMKIYDIIQQENLEEGWKEKALTGLYKAGSKLIGRGKLWHDAEELAPLIAKEIQRAGRKLSPEEIKDLIKNQHMTKEMEDALELAARKTKTGRLTSAERKAVMDKFPDPDPALVAKVEKKAADLADKAALDAAKKGLTGAGETLSKGMWLGSKSIDGLLFAWKVTEFYQPWSEFKENMANADKWMQVPKSAGGWDEDKYKYVLNQQVSILVGRWGSLIVAGRLAKVFPFGLVAKIFKDGGATANILTKASKVQQNIFLAWCNQPDNAEAVAAIMAQPLVSGNNALGLGIGSTVAGAWEKIPGLNALLNKAPGAAPTSDKPDSDAPASGAPNKPTAQQGAKEIEKEPETSIDSDDLTHLDWKDLGNGRLQDPKTGQIWKDIGSGRVENEKTGELSFR